MDRSPVSSYMDAAAALVGLAIPASCRPGVEANLALFLHHASIVAEHDDDPARDPAETLHP